MENDQDIITVKELRELHANLDKDLAEFIKDVAHLRATNNPAALTATNVWHNLLKCQKIIGSFVRDESAAILHEGTPSTKLYVWENPFPKDYSGDWIVAIGKTAEEAQQAAALEIVAHSRYDMDSALAVLGEPDETLEAPVARWFHWEE